MKKTFNIFVLLTVIIWQLADSISKILCSPFIKSDSSMPFSIVITTNKGAAFGLLKNYPYLLGILGILVIILIAFYVYKKLTFNDKAKILIFSSFCAGVLGNTFQRLKYGHVEDFIKINFFDFPVFNIYDILICACVFFYIFLFLLKRIKN